MKAILSLLLATMFLAGGCKQTPPKSTPDFSRLPQKVDHAPLAKTTYITGAALLDSLRSGNRLSMYYIVDESADKPEFYVPLPGLERVSLGNITDLCRRQPLDRTLFLICLYGDDSKRIGMEIAKTGHYSYYLDGGMMKLSNDIKDRKLTLPPR